MRVLDLALLVPALVVSLPAFALQQPDGTTIPTTASLQGLFDARGETISALADAATTPETFTPSCGLTFEVLQRNAGFKNSFGWYNVTGQKPTPAELHEFLSCNDGVGTIKVLMIKSDPAYAGGQIGFYQAAGPGCPTAAANQNLFFSEKAYNPDGSMANPFIHLLTYDSTATPKAFYFAWEDLLSGGDNDFDDLTTFVTGITCTGGGAPCDTGLLGVCALGTMQCQSGVLTCVQQIQPQTEACDGFDNDCNDVIDEGDLCPTDQVCDKGTCVPKCSSVEFPCSGGKVCDANGFCVDPACVSVTCPSGQKCISGQCLGPCDNVVCPFGQVCQLGVCLNPCGPITCDTDQVCEAGVCVDKCPCKTCGASETCLGDGHCIDTACAAVTCNAGMHCESGTCVDDCMGVMCPLGQTCQSGACVATMGQGGAGGSSATGLATSGGLTTSNGTSAGGAGGAASGGGAGGNGIITHAEGCGCSVPGDDASSPVALLGLAGLGLLGARRKRARR
jgi:MYXO-CTERM domain-containing protein